MKIPKKIQIADTIISVEFTDKLVYLDDARGSAVYRENKIKLQENASTYPLDKRDIEQTFFHELTHHILHQMGEEDSKNNEKFVGLFAALLTQALRSGDII